jgi:hypothetical protein
MRVASSRASSRKRRISRRLASRTNRRWALAGSSVAAAYLARYWACLCHAQEMTDCLGSQLKKFRHRSRLPFHSSWRPATRRSVRQMICRITVPLGRSSQATVSARAQTSGWTAL